MKPSEADKIIAEFMGYDNWGCPTCEYDGIITDELIYSESLDALVPVWDKMDSYVRMETRQTAEFNDYWHIEIEEAMHLGLEETIQQAAAIATAKAIKELEG